MITMMKVLMLVCLERLIGNETGTLSMKMMVNDDVIDDDDNDNYDDNDDNQDDNN